MIAWMINLSTRIFGHGELGVRIPSVLSMGIASLYLVAIAGRWIGGSAALGAALLGQSILEFNVGGLLATPDGLQGAAWAGAAYHVARAFEEDRWSQWLTAGVWFGFGLLSKYTMVIFLPGVLLYGLLSPLHRKRLAGVRPYAGLLLGSALFVPVILWNAGNSWNSLRHVAFLGGANESLSIHWRFFGDYLASQAALLSPLVFVLVLLAWILSLKRPHSQEHWIYRYLCLTSLPMVAGFAVLSLHSRVYGNWPGAGYLTASVLVAALFSGRTPHPSIKMAALSLGRKLWPWALGTSYLVTFLVLLQVLWPLLPIPTQLDRTSTELRGWRHLGERAGDIVESMPRPEKTFIFGIRYQIASELAFYTPGQPETVSINRWNRPNVYDYWWEDSDLLGWDAVGVTHDPESHRKRLDAVFERVDPPETLEIYRDPVRPHGETVVPDEAPTEVYYLYRAYGFKGGLRWDPPGPGDIRAVDPPVTSPSAPDVAA